MKTRRIGALLLSCVMSVTAVSAVGGGFGCSQTEANADITNADGRTIFRGVYFADGPVGQALPEIWNDSLPDVVTKAVPKNSGAQARAALSAFLEHRWTPETRAWVNGVINAIDEHAPDFYPRFAEAMHSGNHVRVNDAFEEGIAHLKRAVRTRGAMPSAQRELRPQDLVKGTPPTLTSGDSSSLVKDGGESLAANGEMQGAASGEQWYDVDFHVSLEFEGAIAVAVVLIAVAACVFVFLSTPNDEQSQLARDTLIDVLTRRLGRAKA